MTATGLDVVDKTMQTTNIWLKEICEDLGPDRQVAWRVLGAGLRTLRDRLEPELAAHLAAELPLVVRGAYYDRYRPSEQPRLTRSREEFVKRMESDLKNIRPVNPDQALRCVFGVLNHHIRKAKSKRCAARCRKMCGKCGRTATGRRRTSSRSGRRRARCRSVSHLLDAVLRMVSARKL